MTPNERTDTSNCVASRRQATRNSRELVRTQDERQTDTEGKTEKEKKTKTEAGLQV